MPAPITYLPLSQPLLQEVKCFSDQWIGEGYFEEEELQTCLAASMVEDQISSLEQSVSFVALSPSDGLVGIRLSFAPGRWDQLITRGLSEKEWKVSKGRLGYFKSLFVAENFQGLGIGKTLSSLSEAEMKKAGAGAILCHSWKESPENSSLTYLARFGFKKIKEYPRFWSEIDYQCIRCSPSRCQCTGVEMIKYLEDK